jgi:hypothetical protein
MGDASEWTPFINQTDRVSKGCTVFTKEGEQCTMRREWNGSSEEEKRIADLWKNPARPRNAQFKYGNRTMKIVYASSSFQPDVMVAVPLCCGGASMFCGLRRDQQEILCFCASGLCLVGAHGICTCALDVFSTAWEQLPLVQTVEQVAQQLREAQC